MNSFIIISQDIQKQQNYIEKFCKDHGISKFDQTQISQEGSIGVEVIRKLQEALFLKPLQSKEKILVIHQAENLTQEAQNAMLKILEEPPAHTYIFLLAQSDAHFLPTILSRCSILPLDTKRKTEISQEEKEILEKQLAILLQKNMGDKLALAETLAKEKQEANLWLEKIILYLREKLLENPQNTGLALLINALQEAKKVITTTNVSTRVVLEHFFLAL